MATSKIKWIGECRVGDGESGFHYHVVFEGMKDETEN